MKTFPTREDMIAELVPPGTVGAEIGVYRGGFSRELIARKPSKLFLIDAWEPYKAYELDSLCHTNQEDNMEATKNTMAASISAGTCEVIKGYSSMVAKGWPTPLDWLFLDSNHAYEFVLEDLIAWSSHIKPGGILMCHDFTERPAAMEMKFGVVPAVEEFCAKFGWEVFAITEEADWPSCAIRRK
jgi:hypothetical protein